MTLMTWLTGLFGGTPEPPAVREARDLSDRARSELQDAVAGFKQAVAETSPVFRDAGEVDRMLERPAARPGRTAARR